MTQKRQLKYATVAALNIMREEESSSESDDEIEMLLVKAYFKYKSKKRKIVDKNCSIISSTDGNSSSGDNDSDKKCTPHSEPMTVEPQILPGMVPESSYLVNVDSDTELTEVLHLQRSDEEWVTSNEFKSADTVMTGKPSSDCPDTSRAASQKTSFVMAAIGLRAAKLDKFIPQSLSSNSWTCSADFKLAFTISRTAAEELLSKILVNFTWKAGRPTIPVEQSFLMCLWTLATKENFRQISERFGFIGKATVYRNLFLMCQMIQDVEDYQIKWPSGSEADKVLLDFQFSIPGVSDAFPGAFGCLGATHIRIGEHKDKYSGYYNRLNFPSLVVQAVCDSSGRFIDVSPGHKGSCSDATIWHSSSLFEKLKTNPKLLPQDTHLIGHEAYPLSTNLMVPYWPTDGNLLPDQVKYNFILNNRRSLIENAFMKLKQRWTRLQFLDNRNLDERCNDIIMAAFICYNISLDDGDCVDEEYTDFQDDGCAVGQYEDERDDDFEVEEEAIIKRDNIALLCQ